GLGGGSSLGVSGPTFGVGGSGAGSVAQPGSAQGGSAGNSANVTVVGQTVSISGTVGSTFGSLAATGLASNPFTTSPYASESVAAGSVSLLSTGSGSSLNVGGSIASSGGVVMVSTSQLPNIDLIGPSGSSVLYNYTTGGNANIGSINSLGPSTLYMAA